MLDATFVKELAKLGAEAAGPDIIPAPHGAPAGSYYARKADGSLEYKRHPADLRHKAADLESVVAFARTKDAAELWYSRHGVVALLPDVRDTVTMPLSPSPQLAALVKWDAEGRHAEKQPAFIVLLRTLFSGCFPQHPNLLESVRKIDVKRGNDVASEVRQGKVSMSRAMVAEMTGLDKLPEEIVFRVPVFSSATIPAEAGVRVALDPDPTNETFGLIVLPGDVENAFAVGEQWIAERLAALTAAPEGGAMVPVYHGVPG